MENLYKVVAFLKANKKTWYCDACISDDTGIKPPNQINQLTHPLEAAKSEFQRMPSTLCAKCGKNRICTRSI